MRAETAAIGAMWKEGAVGVCARCPNQNLGISQYHRQEQLCHLHWEHPSCPWCGGGPAPSSSPGSIWNPEFRRSRVHPPSTRFPVHGTSSLLCFYTTRVSGWQRAIPCQLLHGLLSFCWCVVDTGSDEWECTHLAAVSQRLPVDSSSGIFLFLLTGSVSF